MYEAQEHSVAVEVIKNLTFQLSNSRPVSCQTLSLLSQFLSTISETGKCQQKRKKRKKEDTVIPPVVDVQVQLFRPLPELSHTTVTKPSDWRTLIWTWDARDKRSD